MLDGMTNIKASEVLKELKDYTEDLPHYSPDEVAEALEIAIKALEQTRWIPVSERLPKEGDSVLCFDPHYPESSIFIGTYCGGRRFEGDLGWTDDVIKWMPLPESEEEE